MKASKGLKESMVEKLGNRKDSGLLNLIIDVNKEELYIVPHIKEHIEIAAALLKKDKREFLNDSFLGSHLIPSTIEIKNGEIIGVLTGVSGMEMGYGFLHTYEQLEKAHTLSLLFIGNGENPKNKGFKDRIIYKYTLKKAA